MAHAVQRTFERPNSELLGVPRERAMGERVQLEAAKLLVERKLLSLTGLAIALRHAAEWNSTLEHALISSGDVRAADYYGAIADVYGVRFVDLSAEPADERLADMADRADYAGRRIVPWRTLDGRPVIATAELSAELFDWGDRRFGAEAYDFVISSPLDIVLETQRLFAGRSG